MAHLAEWAAVLAGGDGRRLQSFTRKLTGDDRPKQFCRLFGNRTLLQDTRQRVFLNVEPERTLYVVTRPHEVFYRHELGDVGRTHVIEQPSNCGTTAAVAYTLARFRALEGDGTIGLFPADHYYRDTGVLQRTVAAAYRLAASHPDSVVLIGAEPTRAETEYGWIEPGPVVETGRVVTMGRTDVRTVRQFCEKPSAALAADMMARHCLWNTLVVVGSLRGFEQLMAEAVPDVWDAFGVVRAASDAQEEHAVARALYAALHPSDFSRNVLSVRPDRLLVISLPDAGWTDLGQPHRVLDVLADRNEVIDAPRLMAG
jgi:mannose-1-phosphate guanylyltransferase